MKALERDRGRRYETANDLARDLERFLAGEPAPAGPPSALYRLRKLARRHRVVVLVASLFALTLILGTTVSTWLAIRATDAERLAEGRLAAEKGERERGINAEWEGRHRLYEAKLAEALASRWSGRAGRRFQGLAALAEGPEYCPASTRILRPARCSSRAPNGVRHSRGSAPKVRHDMFPASWRRAWSSRPPRTHAPRRILTGFGWERLEARECPSGGYPVIADTNKDAVHRFDGETGEFIDTFVPKHYGGMNQPWGLLFGPDGNGDSRLDLYLAEQTVNGFIKTSVKWYDGVTGAHVDDFVPERSGALEGAVMIAFTETDPVTLAYTGAVRFGSVRSAPSGAGENSKPDGRVHGDGLFGGGEVHVGPLSDIDGDAITSITRKATSSRKRKVHLA